MKGLGQEPSGANSPRAPPPRAPGSPPSSNTGGTRKKPAPPSLCSVPTSSRVTLRSAPVHSANGETEVREASPLTQGHPAGKPQSTFCLPIPRVARSSVLGPQAFSRAGPQARSASRLGQTYSSSRVQLTRPFVQAKVPAVPVPLPRGCPSVIPARLSLGAPLSPAPASQLGVRAR